MQLVLNDGLYREQYSIYQFSFMTLLMEKKMLYVFPHKYEGQMILINTATQFTETEWVFSSSSLIEG